MATSDFRAQFETVEAMTDARKRGLAFEDLVVGIFGASHFDVQKNPGTARPRQTDVLATRASETFLIECKWRTSRADIDDVDSLRSRLRRTSGAIGVLISVPGFSGTAISEVADHRHQPILLISGDEFRRLVDRPEELTPLLWRKRQALLVDGQALVDEPPQRKRARRRRALPDTSTRFTVPGHPESPVFACRGGFDGFAFTHELVDIDWVLASGTGVTLDISVPARNEREILNVVEKLADLGWASLDARWSIQQSTTNWHGFGVASFAAELPGWQARAKTPDAHHSEEFCYVDNCTGGYYTLTSTLSVQRFRRATDTALSFQLQGIPLDTAPLLQLCRSVGVHHGVYFRPLAEQSRHSFHLPDWMTGPVEPVGLVETIGDEFDSDSEWVTGIVIENPFKHMRWLQSEERERVDLSRIERAEFLVCNLGQYHRKDDRQYSYRLLRIETTRTSSGAVFRPSARWDWADESETATETTHRS